MTDNYRPYSAYKSSGIEWLGAIPIQWSIIKLKYLLREKVTDGPHETPVFIDEGVPFYSVDSIQNGILIKDNPRYISSYDHNRFISKCFPEFGDLLVGKAASIGKIAIIDIESEFSIWSPLALVKPSQNKINNKYLYYLLSSSVLQYQIRQLSNSNTQFNLAMEDIPELLTIIPPLPEQQAIAAFLDRQTAKIDALIAKLEGLIELLQEKRTALISQAVTKGLDPSEPMKESGVEWLGLVPVHWEVLPLFKHIKERKVKNFGKFEENVLSLSYGNIVRREVENNFGLLPESFETYQIIEPGNIILRLTDLQNDKRSLRVGLVKERGIITSAYTCLENNEKIIPEYLYALLHTYDINKVFYAMGAGVRQTMKFADLKHMPLLVPPVNEQKLIVQELGLKINYFENIVEKLFFFLNKLNELRQSLVTNAVTGKIDVRAQYE